MRDHFSLALAASLFRFMRPPPLSTLCSSVRNPGSPSGGMNSFDHSSDFAVLENLGSMVSPLDGDVHHGTCQFVGTNHLVGKQYPKRGVNRTQQAITEVRFLPRLDRVDVRGPEDINAREARREECLLSLSLIACERHSTSSRRVRAATAQE